MAKLVVGWIYACSARHILANDSPDPEIPRHNCRGSETDEHTDKHLPLQRDSFIIPKFIVRINVHAKIMAPKAPKRDPDY